MVNYVQGGIIHYANDQLEAFSEAVAAFDANVTDKKAQLVAMFRDEIPSGDVNYLGISYYSSEN